MKINLSIIIVLACLYGANHIVSAKTVQALQPEHTYDNESEIDSYSTRSDEATENEEQNWPASMASGTLPIMYINTENGAPVVDKVTPIPADLWIDIPEKCDSKEYALGSENEPLKLTIRGRGNSTWLLDKKPYKLKFEAKTALCGMPKHKHYALLTANSVHILGMELARQVGLGWSPNIYPVELVLNGEYLGAYDLIESIKIDKNRLDIFEQDDLEEDPDIIPYGWLVEVDNYDDEYQVKIQEPGCTPIKVTHHSPEELSEQQRQWLINSFTEINNVINSSNSEEREHWVDYIDAVSMARYFIVREILQDYDGFNGSMYMYRDNEGDSTFWKMGPMWDTAFNAWSEPTDWTMFDLPSWSVWKFLPEIFYTQNFIAAFNTEWDAFYPSKMEQVKNVLLDYSLKCVDANLADKSRWPDKRPDMAYSYSYYMFVYMEKRAKWIDENKHITKSEVSGINADNPDIISIETFDLCGQRIDNQSAGLCIKKTTYSNGKITLEKILKK